MLHKHSHTHTHTRTEYQWQATFKAPFTSKQTKECDTTVETTIFFCLGVPLPLTIHTDIVATGQTNEILSIAFKQFYTRTNTRSAIPSHTHTQWQPIALLGLPTS